MTIPLLIELGYEKDFSTAIVAVAGGLGVIIPPSIPFIMYAMATGESVSDLFLACLLYTSLSTRSCRPVIGGKVGTEPVAFTDVYKRKQLSVAVISHPFCRQIHTDHWS